MISTCISAMVSFIPNLHISKSLTNSGMNDVLPKPFTKDGMLRALEKHLPQFRKPATTFPHQQQIHASAFPQAHPAQAPLGLNMSQLSAPQSLKDDTSPGKSPATASSWHSPSQLPGPSPIGAPPGFMQQQQQQQPIMREGYMPAGAHGGAAFSSMPPRTQPHRRGMSDMSGVSEEGADLKRQRMFPPGQGGFAQ